MLNVKTLVLLMTVASIENTYSMDYEGDEKTHNKENLLTTLTSTAYSPKTLPISYDIRSIIDGKNYDYNPLTLVSSIDGKNYDYNPLTLVSSTDALSSTLFPVYDQLTYQGSLSATSIASAAAFCQIRDAIQANNGSTQGITFDAPLYLFLHWSESTNYQNIKSSALKKCPFSVLIRHSENSLETEKFNAAKAITQIPITNLTSIKNALYTNNPVLVGIKIYSSFEMVIPSSTVPKGIIPLPNATQEELLGNRTLMLTGYDDNATYSYKYNYTNTSGISNTAEQTETGYLTARNSLGGILGGYYYIPYSYIRNDLTNSISMITKYFQ